MRVVSVKSGLVAACRRWNAMSEATPMSSSLFGTVEIGMSKRSEKKLKLVKPKDWKAGFMPGSLEPTATYLGKPIFGKTELVVGSNCDGRCETKDWAAVSDKQNFQPLANGAAAGQGKVVKDVKGKNTRTMVFESANADSDFDTAVTIMTAWWDPDGEKYFTCRAVLGVPAKSLADVFEKVCSKVSGD
jgi:hypothetical protein